MASDWFCLDCELMPWSAKAQELLRHQYAATGAAAQHAVAAAVAALNQARERGTGSEDLLASFRERTAARLVRDERSPGDQSPVRSAKNPALLVARES